jgi:hypothetical protein
LVEIRAKQDRAIRAMLEPLVAICLTTYGHGMSTRQQQPAAAAAL